MTTRICEVGDQVILGWAGEVKCKLNTDARIDIPFPTLPLKPNQFLVLLHVSYVFFFNLLSYPVPPELDVLQTPVELRVYCHLEGSSIVSK